MASRMERSKTVREYVVNRPDAGAMRTLLERESDPEGLIVRLAWLAGLSRDEIAALCWEQVSVMDERLELPDRTIPMAEELRSYLWRLYQNRKSESPYVVVSERYGDRMQPESISRLARQALDRSGQKDVRLLHVQPKQCTLILKRMVTSGEIAKQGQKYLPQEQKAE